MVDNSELSKVCNYALKPAIDKHDYDIVKYCVDHGANITTQIIMKYLVKADNDLRGPPLTIYQKDPIFDAFIDKLPADECFHNLDIKQCIYSTNRYYFETILSMKNHDGDGSILVYCAAREKSIPQYATDLLVKHGFTISTSIIKDINHFALSRLIVAGFNLSDTMLATFNVCLRPVNRDPNTHKVLQLLINYLISNPRARSHFIITKYIMYKIRRSIKDRDVVNYIWTLYCFNTFGFHQYCVAKYQKLLNPMNHDI
jgi:hypothetical protein